MNISPSKLRVSSTVMCVATLIVAALSGAATWQTMFPLSAPAIFPFSETYYARAVAAQAPSVKIKWAQKAIQAAPRRAENWMLMGYAYRAYDGRNSARVLSAIRQSYAVAPLSPDVHDWRLQFTFSSWPDMPADIRKFAIREANTYSTRSAGLAFLKTLSPGLTDKDARFAVDLIIRARESRKQADWARTQVDAQ